MKLATLILSLLVIPAQAQAACTFLFFGCHRAQHHHHHYGHRHHHVRVIVEKRTEKVIVEKPAPAPVIIEKPRPLSPLDPVK